MLADVADVLDDPEVNGAGGEVDGAAVGAEGVEEGAGSGVIGLAFLTDDAGDGGETSEEVERLGF